MKWWLWSYRAKSVHVQRLLRSTCIWLLGTKKMATWHVNSCRATPSEVPTIPKLIPLMQMLIPLTRTSIPLSGEINSNNPTIPKAFKDPRKYPQNPDPKSLKFPKIYPDDYGNFLSEHG